MGNREGGTCSVGKPRTFALTLFTLCNSTPDFITRLKLPRAPPPPPEMSTSVMKRFFCFPYAARAGDLLLAGKNVDGVVLTPATPVWPCSCMLAVGFTWALYFCQRGGEELCPGCPGLASSTWMHDGAIGPIIVVSLDVGTQLWNYLYVDNLGTLSTDAATTTSAIESVCSFFSSVVLHLHE